MTDPSTTDHPVSKSTIIRRERRARVDSVFGTLLGVVILAAGLVGAGILLKAPTHNDKLIGLCVGVAILGALMASPKRMGESLKTVGGFIKDLVPWGKKDTPT